MRRGHVVYRLCRCNACSQQSRRQFRVFSFFTVTVAVVYVDEIVQDSPSGLAYRRGRYSRVVDLGIHVTEAAIAEDVCLKKQRIVDKKYCVVVS